MMVSCASAARLAAGAHGRPDRPGERRNRFSKSHGSHRGRICAGRHDRPAGPHRCGPVARDLEHLGGGGQSAGRGWHHRHHGGSSGAGRRHTLLMSTNAIVITPHLKALPYDPIADFEPITIVGREYHHMMVTPNLPVNSVKEFIALAKSTPGGLTFSSAGPGSAPFLGMQRFMQAAGIPSMVHVPYPGSMPAVLALVTGDVQSMFSSPSTTLQIVRDGKVRLLAAASPTRDPNAPEAPTLAESGLPGFESNTWFALMASVEDAGRCPGEDPRRCRPRHARSRGDQTDQGPQFLSGREHRRRVSSGHQGRSGNLPPRDRRRKVTAGSGRWAVWYGVRRPRPVPCKHGPRAARGSPRGHYDPHAIRSLP